jgi:hypothetical protein
VVLSVCLVPHWQARPRIRRFSIMLPILSSAIGDRCVSHNVITMDQTSMPNQRDCGCMHARAYACQRNLYKLLTDSSEGCRSGVEAPNDSELSGESKDDSLLTSVTIRP